MPGFPLTVSTRATCLHQATASVVPDQTKVTILNQPVAIITSQITVAGCPFTLPGGKYSPCVTISWTMTSAKVTILGKALLLMSQPGTGVGPGIGKSAEKAPQGPPTVNSNQTKVSVT